MKIRTPIIAIFRRNYPKDDHLGDFQPNFLECPKGIPMRIWKLAMENMLGYTYQCEEHTSKGEYYWIINYDKK